VKSEDAEVLGGTGIREVKWVNFQVLLEISVGSLET